MSLAVVAAISAALAGMMPCHPSTACTTRQRHPNQCHDHRQPVSRSQSIRKSASAGQPFGICGWQWVTQGCTWGCHSSREHLDGVQGHLEADPVGAPSDQAAYDEDHGEHPPLRHPRLRSSQPARGCVCCAASPRTCLLYTSPSPRDS
eukprot:TRINITY_DN5376_c0_g1_i8.p2 TRINITY_DN5376_c0_g1~~TRINITY_DN5376_c0_g1_i8.p2  ORF type:complete len:148 (-),score=15.52 TRINITY_DN5376_c0_g1_i8:150-593(-)